MSTQTEHAMPFGKHKDKPLDEVPPDYLLWALSACKPSSGLRLAIGEALRKRNLEAPPTPTVKIPDCDRCGNTLHECHWQTDSAGRKRIRAECRYCHRFLMFAPMIEPFVTEADANARMP